MRQWCLNLLWSCGATGESWRLAVAAVEVYAAAGACPLVGFDFLMLLVGKDKNTIA